MNWLLRIAPRVAPNFALCLMLAYSSILPSVASGTEVLDLAGPWTFTVNHGRGQNQHLGTLEIHQEGTLLQGKWLDLTQVMRDEFGFFPGDVALKGVIEKNVLHGQLQLHYPVGNREPCPHKWKTWEPLELSLPNDLVLLNGRFRNSAISPRDCSVEDRGWSFFVMARKQTLHERTKETPSRSGVLAESSFDLGADGWTYVERRQATLVEAPYFESGGNPGGYLGAPVGIGDRTPYWYAPIAFLGEKGAAKAAVLLLDLKTTVRREPTEIILAGADRELVNFLEPGPAGTWTTHSLRLSAAAGWRNRATGNPATETEMDEVLSLLVTLEVSAKPGSGLDNIVLSSEGIANQDRSPATIVDRVPRQIILSMEEHSATVNKAMNLQVQLQNAENQRVSADKNYAIKLSSEAAKVRPDSVVIPEGATHAAVRVYGERPGPISVRGATTSGELQAGGVQALVCDIDEISGVVFNADAAEAPLGQRIGATFQLVNHSNRPVTDDAGAKRLEIQVGGVGQSVTPNLGWIEQGRCIAEMQLVSDRPGDASVVVSFGRLGSKKRVFRFYLPLSPLVFAIVSLGGLLGSFARAASVWSRSRRWKPMRWIMASAVGVIGGVVVFLVYYFGALEILPNISGGRGLVFLLGLIGGYLGPTAIERVADHMLPPSKAA